MLDSVYSSFNEDWEGKYLKALGVQVISPTTMKARLMMVISNDWSDR